MERKEIERRVETYTTAMHYCTEGTNYFLSASILIESSAKRDIGLQLLMSIVTLLGTGYELSFKAWKRSKNNSIKSMHGHDLVQLQKQCDKDGFPCNLADIADRLRKQGNFRKGFFNIVMEQQVGKTTFEDHFHNLNALYGTSPYLARYPLSQRIPSIDVEILCAVGEQVCEEIRPHCLKALAAGMVP